MHEYRLFGLPLRSAIPLPELEPDAHGDPDAIAIAVGRVAETPGEDDPRHHLAITPDGAILSVLDVARFQVRDGRAILVDPHPDASDRNVRLVLLGSAMAVLLHQRGILPLHANAIDVDGRAVAIMGASGAGKSTLAAAFHDRGRRILSDDVCAVSRDGDSFSAQPGIPRLRLWRDAVERSGRVTGDYERAFDALDKYSVRTTAAVRSEALPLAAIVLLASHDGDPAIDIRRLAGVEAVEALIANTYRGSFIRTVGDGAAHFATCLALQRAVPVFRLSRPWDPARIAETMDRIEHLLAGTPSAPDR
ncbi:MAG: hypothetical protein V4618_07425 [Pseudomonadota bacterium]